MTDKDKLEQELKKKSDDFIAEVKEYEEKVGCCPSVDIILDLLMVIKGSFYEHIGVLEACKKELFDIMDMDEEEKGRTDTSLN